jgi:hypothetical protein
MQSQVKQSKIVFSDNGIDKAVTGAILSEDDYFLTLEANNGRTYRIGKKSIVCVEEAKP